MFQILTDLWDDDNNNDNTNNDNNNRLKYDICISSKNIAWCSQSKWLEIVLNNLDLSIDQTKQRFANSGARFKNVSLKQKLCLVSNERS